MEDTKVNKILSQSWTLDIKLKGSWEHNKAKYPLVGGGGGGCVWGRCSTERNIMMVESREAVSQW